MRFRFAVRTRTNVQMTDSIMVPTMLSQLHMDVQQSAGYSDVDDKMRLLGFHASVVS